MRPFSVLGSMTCLLACVGCFAQVTPESTANEVLHNIKFRRAAVDRAVGYGDQMIEPLRQQSRNFALLPGEAPFRVVTILSAIPSPRARATLAELATREEILPRLVGLAGCARRCDPSDANADYLRRIARGEFTAKEEGSARMLFGGTTTISENLLLTYRRLAIIALGGLSDAATVGTLEHILMGRTESLHEDSARSLCKIGGSRAQAALWNVLRSPDAGSRPEALRALVALGDAAAIGATIEALTRGVAEPTNGDLARELAVITGQRFGSDHEAWMRWWQANVHRFQTPAALTCGTP